MIWFQNDTMMKGQGLHPSVDRIFVDVCSICNLRCVMCLQSTRNNEIVCLEQEMMPSETFERVVSHLVETGYMSEYLDLYTWGEPLLNPELDEILEICQSYGIKSIVSTNLSLRSEKIAMLAQHKIEILLVNISGFSDETYVRNHVGGDFGLVLNNLLALRNYRDKIKKIILKYLVFRYNRKEIALARDFCLDNSFQFGACSGAIPCFSSYLRYFEDSIYKNIASEFIDPKSITTQAVKSCPQERTIVLNHKAELVQCCMSQYQGLEYHSSKRISLNI